MELFEVETLIKQDLPDAKIFVEGEGCNFTVKVVSTRFGGLNLVKKQQLVLAALQEAIASGALHAISVKAYTPEEWAKR